MANTNFDNLVRRALRESIEAHAREWEPKFETGNGPVGDDAPFDKGVNEENEACPKCGNKECTCNKEEVKESMETPVEDSVNPAPQDGSIDAEASIAEDSNVAQEPSGEGLPPTSDWDLAPEGGESSIGDSDPFGLNSTPLDESTKKLFEAENDRFQSLIGRMSKLYD